MLDGLRAEEEQQSVEKPSLEVSYKRVVDLNYNFNCFCFVIVGGFVRL